VTEGGSTPSERAASFLEAALALASDGPLDDAALGALVAAARPLVLGDGDTLLQKKGYKVLATLAERRPGWRGRHLGPLLELCLRASPAAVSSAKRYRLRLLRPLIAQLLDPSAASPAAGGLPELDALAGAPGVPGGAAIAAAAGSARREAVARALVGELVLATKVRAPRGLFCKWYASPPAWPNAPETAALCLRPNSSPAPPRVLPPPPPSPRTAGGQHQDARGGVHAAGGARPRARRRAPAAPRRRRRADGHGRQRRRGRRRERRRAGGRAY
jgi:hypothetical protein